MFLNDMNFGFEEKSSSPTQANIKAWVAPALMAASAVIGAVASSGDSGGSNTGGVKPKVLKQTTSGQNKSESDLNMIYGERAQEVIEGFTGQMNDWMEEDRDFFQNTFQPFQESLMKTNAVILPAIEKTAGDALESISRDMVSNQSLRNTFESAIQSGATNLDATMSKFTQELDNLPTVEDRVAQAFAQVEGQFGKAGQALQRRMAEQGRSVSQASERELAIEKAKTKSGVAGAAAEGARAERLNQLSQGLGQISNVQTQAGNQLSLINQADQANKQLGVGATSMQVGGVSDVKSDLAQTTAGLIESEAQKTLGTEQASTSANIAHVDKDIKGAPQLDENYNLTSAPNRISGGSVISAEDFARKKAALDAAKSNNNQNTNRNPIPRSGGPGIGGADGPGTGGAVGGAGGDSAGPAGAAGGGDGPDGGVT